MQMAFLLAASISLAPEKMTSRRVGLISALDSNSSRAYGGCMKLMSYTHTHIYTLHTNTFDVKVTLNKLSALKCARYWHQFDSLIIHYWILIYRPLNVHTCIGLWSTICVKLTWETDSSNLSNFSPPGFRIFVAPYAIFGWREKKRGH